jgi:hypothetical protein
MWWGHPVLLLLLLLGVLLLLIRPSNVVCNTFGTENNVSIVALGNLRTCPTVRPRNSSVTLTIRKAALMV